MTEERCPVCSQRVEILKVETTDSDPNVKGRKFLGREAAHAVEEYKKEIKEIHIKLMELMGIKEEERKEEK